MDFKRSKDSIPAVVNGQKTHLSLCTKLGCGPQTFWYFIQFPCKQWRVFDLRWLIPGMNNREWMNEMVEEWRNGNSRTVLEKVASKIKDIDVFAKIREQDALEKPVGDM